MDGRWKCNASLWAFLLFLSGGNVCSCQYSRSSWHPHAAHSVTEAMRPEGGHIILLDLHLVALEVRELIQADLVLKAVLHVRN